MSSWAPRYTGRLRGFSPCRFYYQLYELISGYYIARMSEQQIYTQNHTNRTDVKPEANNVLVSHLKYIASALPKIPYRVRFVFFLLHGMCSLLLSAIFSVDSLESSQTWKFMLAQPAGRMSTRYCAGEFLPALTTGVKLPTSPNIGSCLVCVSCAKTGPRRTMMTKMSCTYLCVCLVRWRTLRNSSMIYAAKYIYSFFA